MIYLLDTNAAIAIINGRPAGVRTRLQRVAPKAAGIAISSVVLFELWYGVERSEHRRKNAGRLRVFLSGSIAVTPFNEEDAATAGKVRAALEQSGKPIGPHDLLIAAQALRIGATLVTANVSEFQRVEGLIWQDWAA